MAEIINPHDKFFKEMLTQPEAARIFLRDFLPPAVAEQLDLSHLQLVKDSFIDETLQEHFSDLVYEVALRHDGSAFVCVLFEHKSYVDSMTPLQLLRYMVHGWEYALRHRNRLWPVIPVVLYHGAAPWTVARNFQGLFNLPEALSVYVPEFQYVLTDLSAYSDEEIKRTAELGVSLLLLKHIFEPDLYTHLPEVIKLWYTIRQQENALRYLEAMIRYVAATGQNFSAEEMRAAIKAVAPEGDAMLGTIAQEWLQQGLQQGLRQGLLAGIRLGLKIKFGLAGATLMSEIEQIEDVALLQTIGDVIELAATPDEVRQVYHRQD